MRIVTATLLCSLLANVWLPNVLAADQPSPLARNPFARPSSQQQVYESGVVENSDSSGPTLALRATMVGPAKRYANVAGHVLTTGEEIEGYRLLAIHEDYAVFERDGKAITVYVKPQLVEDDE